MKASEPRWTDLLSKKQRKTLSAIAAEAYAHLAPGLDETLDEFRVSQSIIACKFRISEAPGTAFDDIFAHFKALKGQVGEAFDIASGDGTKMRQLSHLIAIAERTAGVTPGYTAAICQNMFKARTPKNVKQSQALLTALEKKAAKAAALHGQSGN